MKRIMIFIKTEKRAISMQKGPFQLYFRMRILNFSNLHFLAIKRQIKETSMKLCRMFKSNTKVWVIKRNTTSDSKAFKKQISNCNKHNFYSKRLRETSASKSTTVVIPNKKIHSMEKFHKKEIRKWMRHLIKNT